MTDQEDNIIPGKIVFEDNNQERKSWAWLGQTCYRSLIVFLSQPFVILLIIFGCFWKIYFAKTCDNSTVWVGIFGAVRQDSFYPHQDYEEVSFYIKLSLFFIVWSIRNWKIATYLQLAKSWNFSTKV